MGINCAKEGAPMKYRKIPVIIDALQFDGSKASADAIIDEFDEFRVTRIAFEPNGKDATHGRLLLPTLEGTMTASAGDFIIRGFAGELYPCKPQIFHKTYEPIE
jgi:hypothetical protein